MHRRYVHKLATRRVAGHGLRARVFRVACGLLQLVAFYGSAEAQTSVTLTDTTQTTTLTATVAEQAVVSVPAAMSITVNNVNVANARPNQIVTVSNLVLATATKQLRISVQANAESFTKPAAATTTWSASDVSWTTTQAWTNATASDGTLSDSAYNVVAICTAGVTSCSTDRLKFTLAANPSITISGTYTIGIVWKFESIGS
jgi:hypothetical protein